MLSRGRSTIVCDKARVLFRSEQDFSNRQDIKWSEMQMDKDRVISLLQNGRQLGMSRIYKADGHNMLYELAVQRIGERWLVYECICDLDGDYFDDDNTKNVNICSSFAEVLEDIERRPDVDLEDLNVLKGQKIFNAKIYIDANKDECK